MSFLVCTELQVELWHGKWVSYNGTVVIRRDAWASQCLYIMHQYCNSQAGVNPPILQCCKQEIYHAWEQSWLRIKRLNEKMINWWLCWVWSSTILLMYHTLYPFSPADSQTWIQRNPKRGHHRSDSISPLGHWELPPRPVKSPPWNLTASLALSDEIFLITPHYKWNECRIKVRIRNVCSSRPYKAVEIRTSAT
jgi:hypothetical protein